MAVSDDSPAAALPTDCCAVAGRDLVRANILSHDFFSLAVALRILQVQLTDNVSRDAHVPQE